MPVKDVKKQNPSGWTIMDSICEKPEKMILDIGGG